MISADAIRGYVDLMVLSLLRTGPSYAYELVQRVSDVSQGEYSIKQTTLYSAVKRLEAAGLVSAEPGVSPTGKSRTYYRLTASGRTQADVKTAEWHQTKAVVDKFVHDGAQGGTP